MAVVYFWMWMGLHADRVKSAQNNVPRPQTCLATQSAAQKHAAHLSGAVRHAVGQNKEK